MADDWCTYCSAFGVSEGDYALPVHLETTMTHGRGSSHTHPLPAAHP